MEQILNYFIEPYQQYAFYQILIEGIAVFLGVVSVLLAKKNHIGVFYTGIVNSALYAYLLFEWGLYGDMLISAYYVIMSFYGWYAWSQKNRQHQDLLIIQTMNTHEKKMSGLIFFISVIFVFLVYHYFEKLSFWWAYVDTLITGLFFVGMWLLSKRKIENWLFFLVGNILAIPLFVLKGFALTGFLYLFLSVVALLGYQSWKKQLPQPKPMC